MPKLNVTVSAEMTVVRRGREIELLLEGKLARAEPEVGLPKDYVDGCAAYDSEGRLFRLFPEEQERARDLLHERLE